MTPDPTTAAGLEVVTELVTEAAREAAALVLTGFRSAPEASHKGPIDLVTRFDHESEELLRRRLGALPFAIIGEEQGGAPGDVAFYVDPIDGTTNFVHGHPFWCVSVGLVVHGLPVLGVVVSPPLGGEWRGWVAASGERRAVRRTASPGSAAVTEEACAVSKTASLDDALLATGFPYDLRTSRDNNLDTFVAMMRRCQAVRRCGSAALDLCLVADGTFDGYWEKKLQSWDVAAGLAIVRAAGGTISDFDGGVRCVERGQAIATNGALHDALVTELARVSTSG